MPKVRIISGNNTGVVVDLPEVEAEAAIDSGYAVAFVEKTKAKVAELKPAPKPERDPRRRR